MTTPIQLKPHTLRISAPRELLFQMMTAFGRGRLKGDNNELSRVISREGDEIVAEFVTKSGPFRYRTVERVTLEAPERIRFEHIEGPLAAAREEFTLRDVDGDTELEHRGEFVWNRIPLIGWLWGRLYVKPVFERTLVKHMAQIKEAAEARAARSHVFRR